MPRALSPLPIVGVAVLLVLSAAAAPAAPATRGGTASLPRVTVIGDSVATALAYDAVARAILAEGIELRLELAPCRRVAQESCPYQGERPANVIQLVESLGPALGRTVIVSVGYNDYEVQYAHDLEDALGALRQAGVEHVLWATMRAARHGYVTMNDAIEAAGELHPELTVVDWNLYSRSHPDWFQADGLHLFGTGARSMATLFHSALERLDIPVRRSPAPTPLQVVGSSLPAATSGRAYAARLSARGGHAPYRWSRGAGFPPWLRLSVRGALTGTVRARPGRLAVAVRVTDAAGAAATRRLILRVRS